MRILHTGDWHLGRTLEGRSRLAEQEQFLDELHEIVVEEKVDVILVAGDVFDSVNPPAAAEQLFYESVARLADKGQRSVVVIAGNHDHPDRLAAAQPLAGEQGITLIGYPTVEVVRLQVARTGEELCLGALAYPSEARLNQVLVEELGDETMLRDHYDQRVRRLLKEMANQFTRDTVNLIMSHLFVAGGSATESERPIEVGGAYTVRPVSFPAGVQYIALGHLHRPQSISGAPAPARYAGSPLAFSFSESGYAKSVTLVDLSPQTPAEVKELYLSSGRPLVTWKAEGGLDMVYRWLEEGRDQDAWIDLEIHLTRPLTLEEIYRLRKMHPGLIHIRPVFPDQHLDADPQPVKQLPLEEQFKRFYKKQTGGAEADEELVKLFLDLVAEQEGEA